MHKVICIAIISMFAISAASAAPAHRSKAKAGCRCYTDQPKCSGEALFSGAPQKCAISGYPQSCAIYSAHGNTELFIYVEQQIAQFTVGSGDTYACVKGTDGVPGNTPRHPIGVR